MISLLVYSIYHFKIIVAFVHIILMLKSNPLLSPISYVSILTIITSSKYFRSQVVKTNIYRLRTSAKPFN